MMVRRAVAAAVIALLALVPVIAAAIGEPYYVTLFTRILILALAAVGLNLILGYGGLVSFGHAMYIGIGAYAVGILSYYGIGNGWLQLAAALGVGGVVALVIGLVCLRTQGDAETVLKIDEALANNYDHWLVREILLLMARVLRRLDLTAKSFFAIVESGSCFAGNLLELLLAADRSYMRMDSDASLAVSELNAGAFLMSNDLTRMQSRYLAEPEKLDEVFGGKKTFDTEEAEKIGLVTFAPDDLDWDDEVRVAIEERTSLSPDALTGMEASLRFAGPETMDTKIYGRLTAWQNWIFQRPNAVGEKGALTNFGKPTPREFDYKRT